MSPSEQIRSLWAPVNLAQPEEFARCPGLRPSSWKVAAPFRVLLRPFSQATRRVCRAHLDGPSALLVMPVRVTILFLSL